MVCIDELRHIWSLVQQPSSASLREGTIELQVFVALDTLLKTDEWLAASYDDRVRSISCLSPPPPAAPKPIMTRTALHTVLRRANAPAGGGAVDRCMTLLERVLIRSTWDLYLVPLKLLRMGHTAADVSNHSECDWNSIYHALLGSSYDPHHTLDTVTAIESNTIMQLLLDQGIPFHNLLHIDNHPSLSTDPAASSPTSRFHIIEEIIRQVHAPVWIEFFVTHDPSLLDASCTDKYGMRAHGTIDAYLMELSDEKQAANRAIRNSTTLFDQWREGLAVGDVLEHISVNVRPMTDH